MEFEVIPHYGGTVHTVCPKCNWPISGSVKDVASVCEAHSSVVHNLTGEPRFRRKIGV